MARTRPSTAFTCSCIILFFIVSHSIAVGQELHNMPLAFELDWVRSHGEFVDAHDSDNVNLGSGECKIYCRSSEKRPVLRTSLAARYDKDFCLEVVYTIRSTHDSAIVAFGWAGPLFTRSNVFAHRSRGDCGKWRPHEDVPNPLPYQLPQVDKRTTDTLRIIRRGDEVEYTIRSQRVLKEDVANVHVSSGDLWISVFPGTTVILHSVRLYQEREPIDTATNFGVSLKRGNETSFREMDDLFCVAPFNFDKNFYATVRGKRHSQSMILGHRDSAKKSFQYRKDDLFRSPVRSARQHVINWASADGRCMFVSMELANGQPGLQLYSKNRSGWRRAYTVSFPTRRLVGKLPEVTVSPDMKTMIFSGWVDTIDVARDLWITHHIRDSIWSDPVTLGAPVNTLQTEGEPFLSADGKHLYFASDGHSGFGCADIFVTARRDSSWTGWTKPQNLGRRINTVNHEISFRTDERNRFWFLMQSQPYCERYVTVYIDSTKTELQTDVLKMPEHPAFQRHKLVERVFCDSSFNDSSAVTTEDFFEGIQSLRATLITYPLSTVSILYNVVRDNDSIRVDSSHVRMCNKLVDVLIRSGIPAGRLVVTPNYNMLYDDEESDGDPFTEKDNTRSSSRNNIDATNKVFSSSRLKAHKRNCFVVRFQ